MSQNTPDQGGAQAVLETVRSCMQVVMSEAGLEMLRLAMDEEVTSLTGARYDRDQSGACRRAGSAPGTVLVEAQPRSIRRPRVRRRGGHGAEVPLATYRDAQCSLELQHRILEALSAGLSSRSVSAVVSPARGTSRSASSRLWCQAGTRWIQEFRSRRLVDDWSVLMIDGIRLSADQTSVVALGITQRTVSRSCWILRSGAVKMQKCAAHCWSGWSSVAFRQTPLCWWSVMALRPSTGRWWRSCRRR